jgi:hypothetical protein
MSNQSTYYYSDYEHAAVRRDSFGQYFLKLIEKDGLTAEREVNVPLPKLVLDIIRENTRMTREEYEAL